MSPEDKQMADTDTMLQLETAVKERTKQHVLELLIYDPNFRKRVASIIMDDIHYGRYTK